MENRKIVYGSTSDFLRYINARTKEKEKMQYNRYSYKDNMKQDEDFMDNMSAE